MKVKYNGIKFFFTSIVLQLAEYKNLSQQVAFLLRPCSKLPETFILESVTVMDSFLFRIFDNFGSGCGAPLHSYFKSGTELQSEELVFVFIVNKS